MSVDMRHRFLGCILFMSEAVRSSGIELMRMERILSAICYNGKSGSQVKVVQKDNVMLSDSHRENLRVGVANMALPPLLESVRVRLIDRNMEWRLVRGICDNLSLELMSKRRPMASVRDEGWFFAELDFTLYKLTNIFSDRSEEVWVANSG